MANRIQIVEDERIVALDLKIALQSLGFDVVASCASGEEAITAAGKLKPDLILMDIHLEGGMSGTEAALIIRQTLDIPVVYLTAFAEENILQQAEKSAPYGYLLKPFELRELNATIRMALACRTAEVEVHKKQRLLMLAVETAQLGIWEWDQQQSTFTGQGYFGKITGLDMATRQEAVPPFLRLLEHADQSRLNQLLKDRGRVDMITTITPDDGDAVWVEMSVQEYEPQWQESAKQIGVLRDITERIKSEQLLQQAGAVFQSTAEGIVVIDGERLVKSANPAFLRLTGYALMEILGQDIDELLHVKKHTPDFYSKLIQLGDAGWHGEVMCQRKNGEHFPAWEHICLVSYDMDLPAHYIIGCTDVSSIKQAEIELNRMAFHDALTDLGNRYLLNEQLAIELQRAETSGTQMGLVFIDLDGFKLINDGMGHAMGDQLLQVVAQRIRETIRRADIPVRFGGDEFFIICPHSSEADCTAMADRLLEKLEQPMQAGKENIVVTCSIGIALYPQHGTTAEKLLSAADSAMYQAKQAGKRRHCTFNESMAEKVHERLRLEQRLRQAVKERSFTLHYQPLIRVEDNVLIGFEALLRWQDEGQHIPPDLFIPVAEECGLIQELGSWVLQQACRAAQHWNADYHYPLKVAVNVSVMQFVEPDFRQRVARELADSGLAPHLLELEITESVLQSLENSKRILKDLKQIGVSVAIDDFGTGYSSMAVLKDLAVDRLKIDRSFICNTPAQPQDAAVCKAIIMLAKSLMLGITAEGVEEIAQVDFLRDNGCDTFQGYYYSPPLDSAALEQYLRHYFSAGPAAAASSSR
jgi:diguanylate cyclase (GGDEF)-like protein/PAS domain S-box-containing protein